MDLKDLPKPKRSGLAWWDALLKEEKYEALLPYLDAGGSNKHIAELHHISEGSVARIRHMRNQRLHPENYDSSGKPISRQKKAVAKKKTVKSTPKVVLLRPKKPVIPRPVQPASVQKPQPKLKLVESREASETKPEPRAEHAPGQSPVLKKIPGLQKRQSGEKNPAFPDDMNLDDLRAIQKMYGDDSD